jgi:hypothetical protein
MKIISKITLLLILTLAIQISFGQPVITNSINLSVGDTYRIDGYDAVSNIDPTPAGPNQTWNFADVTGDVVLTGKPMSCVSPSQTPFADSAAVIEADICAFGNDEISTHYEYFKNNNSSQLLTAMADITSIGEIDYGRFIDGIVNFKFPFTFNDTYSYSYEALGYDVINEYYFVHDSSTLNVEADAYGTITTPIGTFEDCLRIKITQHQFLWARFEPGGNWIFLGDNISYEYKWMAPNIKVPVMQVFEYCVKENIYTVHYLVDYNFVTKTKEISETNVKATPNPVSNKLVINSDKAFNKIRLLSITGQQLKLLSSENEKTKKQTVDFSTYPTGSYLIELEFDDGTIMTKKIIK